jgi:hypothetical protein
MANNALYFPYIDLPKNRLPILVQPFSIGTRSLRLLRVIRGTSSSPRITTIFLSAKGPSSRSIPKITHFDTPTSAEIS